MPYLTKERRRSLAGPECSENRPSPIPFKNDQRTWHRGIPGRCHGCNVIHATLSHRAKMKAGIGQHDPELSLIINRFIHLIKALGKSCSRLLYSTLSGAVTELEQQEPALERKKGPVLLCFLTVHP